MNEEEKKAIVELKHYANITTHWKQEEFTDSEIDNYIKLTLNYISKLRKELDKKDKVINEISEKLYKLKIKLELNDLLEDCFIPREFSDINNCIKTDCKECIKEYFYKKVEEENV